MSRFVKLAALAGLFVIAGTFLAPVYAQDKIEVPAGAVPHPIKTTPPKYPTRLAERGIEGWVLLEFFVEIDGSVTEIEVLDSDPPGAFERAAIAAVRTWKYQPAQLGGKPQRMSTQLVLTFELEGGSGRSGNPGRSSKSGRLSYDVDRALNSGDLETARTKLLEMEALLAEGEGSRSWLNFLYSRYFIATEDYPRAVHHLRHSLAKPLSSYSRKFLKAALPTLFKAEVALGYYAPAVVTYKRIRTSRIVKRKSDIHPIYEQVDALLKGGAPLATKAIILGNACFECGTQSARWRYPLSRKNFQIQDLQGAIETIVVSCKRQRATFDFAPNMSWSISDNWGSCELQLVGDIGTEFRLLEFD